MLLTNTKSKLVVLAVSIAECLALNLKPSLKTKKDAKKDPCKRLRAGKMVSKKEVLKQTLQAGAIVPDLANRRQQQVPISKMERIHNAWCLLMRRMQFITDFFTWVYEKDSWQYLIRVLKKLLSPVERFLRYHDDPMRLMVTAVPILLVRWSWKHLELKHIFTLCAYVRALIVASQFRVKKRLIPHVMQFVICLIGRGLTKKIY